MKRTMNRLLIRFALLCVAIILGAIAVAQAQRGLDSNDSLAEGTVATEGIAEVVLPTTPANEPIPFANDSESNIDVVENQPEPQPPMTWAALPTEAPSDQLANETPIDSAYVQPDYVDQSNYENEPVNRDEGRQYDTHVQTAGADTPDSEVPQFAPLAPPADYDHAGASDFEMPDYEGPAADTETYQPETDQAHVSAASDSLPPIEESVALDSVPVSSAVRAPTDVQERSTVQELSIVQETTIEQESAIVQEPTAIASISVPIQEPTAPASLPLSPVVEEPRLNMQTELEATAQSVPSPTRFVDNHLSSRKLRGQSAESVPSGTSGNGKPGPSDLEGPQTPTLRIVKRAPNEIQVGKAAEFQVTIRNVGQVAADDVVVRDEVPFGTELMDSSPPATMDGEGGLVWQLGPLRPGNESTVTMRVMPRTEGEIGSVAKVMFASAASAKARCTRPQLSVEHVGPRKVLMGEDVVFKIKLHNPGTGSATNVVIEEDVPEGLRHSAGSELEYAVGTLRPGESRLLELTLKADKPGKVDNLIVARGDSSLAADHSFQFEVVAPLLRITVQGPRRRYLEREATFDINVANPGTATAQNIDLVAHLPRGLKFASTNNQGQYNPQEHAVHWDLAELPDNEMGTVRLTVVPTDMGDQKIRIEGKANMNLADSTEHVVTVDGLAALLYTVKDLSDPIEVGGQTTYEIRVVNQGSKTATNLILAAQASAGMQPVSGEGPTQGVVEGQKIIFDPLARLAPQGETNYRVHVKAFQAGDMRLKFHLVSDEVTNPVTKEESTHVYSDE
jgi:uncharacterized repeat protein (TIGR01451 family)